MKTLQYALLLTCSLGVANDEPPPPNPQAPVNYVAWLDAKYSAVISANAADAYNQAFAAFVDDPAAKRVADEAGKHALGIDKTELLHRWLDANEHFFAAFEAASQTPDCFFRGSKATALLEKELPHVGQMKDATLLMLTRLRLRSANGTPSLAVEDVCTLLRAARHMRSQPHMVEYLYGERMAASAYEELIGLADGSDKGLDYQRTLELIRQADPDRAQAPRQFNTERLMFLDALQRYCEDRDGDGRFERTSAQFLDMEFDVPLTGEALIQQYDQLREKWTEALTSDYLTGQRLARALNEQQRATGGSLVHVMMEDRWRISLAARRTQALRNGARVALGMRAFRGRESHWPENLVAATDGESPDVRHDPFSSGDMIYRHVGEAPLVYSVGLDGKDDGGKRSPDGKLFGDTGDSVFWPPLGPSNPGR